MPVAALASPPASAFAPPSSEQAVERYLEASFERLQRTLVAATSHLLDPVGVADLEHARRRLGLLVESLTGVAVGITVGQLGSALRRGFGADVCAATEQLLTDAGRAPNRAVHVRVVSSPPTGPALVDRFRGELRARLLGAVGMTRALLRELAATVQRVAPDRLGALAMTLALLTEDDADALMFGDHVQLGWQFYGALVSGRPEPTVVADARWARCAVTWRTWSRPHTGRRRAPHGDLSHEQIVNGAILQIA